MRAVEIMIGSCVHLLRNHDHTSTSVSEDLRHACESVHQVYVSQISIHLLEMTICALIVTDGNRRREALTEGLSHSMSSHLMHEIYQMAQRDSAAAASMSRGLGFRGMIREWLGIVFWAILC
jgi:hypothetical protein